MIPSPVCFTSSPRTAASSARTMRSCVRSSSIAFASPSRCVTSVEPTMSVNRIVRNADSTYASPGGCAGIDPRKLFTRWPSTSMIFDAISPCASRCTASAASRLGASTRQKTEWSCGSNQ